MASRDKKTGALRWRRVDFTVGRIEASVLVKAHSYEEAVEIWKERVRERLSDSEGMLRALRETTDRMVEVMREQICERVQEGGWQPRASGLVTAFSRATVGRMDWPDEIPG